MQRGPVRKEEIINEIRQLSSAEKEAVIEAVSSMREETQGDNSTDQSLLKNKSRRPEEKVDNQGQLSIDERMAVVQHLFGILKREGETPTDEELKEEYANYLAEKYS